MRDWLKNLNEIDRDCVHQYEYLLGRHLNSIEEYVEIDKQVDEMILEWDSRQKFFEAYPDLKSYRNIKEKGVIENNKKPSLDARIQEAALEPKREAPLYNDLIEKGRK